LEGGIHHDFNSQQGKMQRNNADLFAIQKPLEVAVAL